MKYSLFEIFNTIPTPPKKRETDAPLYAVESISEFSSYYVGKNQEGWACLLVESDDHTARIHPAIRLEYLEAQFDIPCRVSSDGGVVHQGNYTVICCRSSEQETTKYFLSVCESILNIVGDKPKRSELSSAITRLASIFQKLQKPARRSANGLFGELFFIKNSKSPIRALGTWRNENIDRYDFSDGDIRIEVKASATRTRVHTFSYEQCNLPPETRGVVASLFAERSTKGISLQDLIKDIETAAANRPDLIFKLWDVVADTLGVMLNEALAIRFDAKLAASSLAFFNLDEVPAIRGEIPIGVSDIHFRSDLSALSLLSIDELIESDPQFRELLPPLEC